MMIRHTLWFDKKLNKALNEYKLAGDDFGPEKRDNSVRKAHNMQPSANFGGQPTVPPDTEEAKIPLKLSYDIYKIFQRYWKGQRDPLYALLSRRGDSNDLVTVFATQKEVDRLIDIMWDLLRSKNPRERETAESLYYMLETLDNSKEDEDYE